MYSLDYADDNVRQPLPAKQRRRQRKVFFALANCGVSRSRCEFFDASVTDREKDLALTSADKLS